jgi:tRNA-Thr(GGU) m(6)t(6)A37 methyltransferase TsaA
MTDGFEVRPVGWVKSPLVNLADAPRQANEGAPEATITFVADVADALRDLRAGDDVLLLTWLDRAQRDVLAVHPRDDRNHPLTGVFSTRSPDRPNPIGLHRVRILAIDGLTVRVNRLEALDGTPVLDVKPPMGPVDG